MSQEILIQVEQVNLQARLKAWVQERSPKRVKKAYTLYKERGARQRIANTIIREMQQPHEQIPLTSEQMQRWEQRFDRDQMMEEKS